MDFEVELLKRCPEITRAVLPHDRLDDTDTVTIGATLARCQRLAQLRLLTHGAHLHHAGIRVIACAHDAVESTRLACMVTYCACCCTKPLKHHEPVRLYSASALMLGLQAKLDALNCWERYKTCFRLPSCCGRGHVQ